MQPSVLLVAFAAVAAASSVYPSGATAATTAATPIYTGTFTNGTNGTTGGSTTRPSAATGTGSAPASSSSKAAGSVNFVSGGAYIAAAAGMAYLLPLISYAHELNLRKIGVLDKYTIKGTATIINYNYGTQDILQKLLRPALQK
ncbi:hypothetical protein DSL72_005102 [Monilinia vaccinii-corymbosi]|uniref:Uncharacterized protein n=1 Tax=Monilinia vaccinii-corymbosi TaxID=61207 RepID=A0A8A3PEQ5_9HELO|nr:hypothetical protein DSL72_005102 [Monilinia vaccinii-corymbosi]